MMGVKYSKLNYLHAFGYVRNWLGKSTIIGLLLL